METKRLVLVVDDNFVNRQILSKILSEEYNVLCAENGMKALEFLNQFGEEISAVLLDLAMPVMDGYEFLKIQQSDIKLSQVPIIVTTQQESEKTEIEVLSLGAHDYLTKPYNPSIIKHRLANTIKLREKATFVNTVEHDSLTGVLSKEFFYKLASEKIRNSDSKFDLICIDIERFKLVNDLFGKEEGDKLLKYLALLIVKQLKGTGICSRIGADVFAALIPHNESYDDAIFEEAIKQFNQYPINITLALKYGIYPVGDLNVPIDVMCDRARLAAENIKGKYGVNFAYYDDSIRDKMIDEQNITDSMKQALNEGQFEVHYQPKYDIVTGRIIGAEALARWVHPEKGMLPPISFIPLFEKNGFITELDFYIWEEVCKKLKQWKDANIQAPPVSVNVSRVDIYNKDLTKNLLKLIKKYGIEPKYLHLEITESAYTENPEQMIAVVANLKKIGFVIEMDDFGTGYSSLNILSELPIDIIKLDMRFLQNKPNRSGDNIISFIIGLAKWMGLTVVAEGVEFSEQVAMLRNMDCNYAQGFFYSKPLQVAYYENLLLHSEVGNSINIKQGKADDNQEQLVKKINANKKTMLVVDDMSVNRKILEGIFKSEYNIIQAENGFDAIQTIKSMEGKIDIILLDLLMPIMDGFETLEKVKSDKINKDIPIVVTSQEGIGGEIRALNAGADDFISKPYNKNIAVKRVKNIMASVEIKKLSQQSLKDKALFKMHKTMDEAENAVMLCKISEDAKIDVISYNENLCKIIGFSFEEYEKLLASDDNHIIIYNRDLNKFKAELANSVEEQKNAELPVRIKTKSDGYKWVKFTAIKTSVEKSDRRFYCVITEMTITQKEKEMQKNLLEHDELTGAYNIVKFAELVGDYLGRNKAENALMLMVDIKNVKGINWSLGFVEGNNVICRTYKTLERFFRQTDIIARVDSGRFGVFVKGNIDKKDIKKRMAKLSQALDFEIGNGEDTTKSHCSIGVSEVAVSGHEYKVLFKNATTALLSTKKLEQDRFAIYTPEAKATKVKS